MKTHHHIAALAALFFTVLAHAQPASPLDTARAALKTNNLAEAETLLVPLTGPTATDAAAFFTLGQVRERQRRLKESVAAYEQATKLDATKSEYFSALGAVLGQHMGEISFIQQAFLAGKLKRAFEKSVELDPRNISGLIGLARYYTNAPEIAGGSLAKAQALALRLQEVVPFLGEIEQGNIASHDERYVDALAHYEAAAKMNPTSADAKNQCGRMLLKLKRPDEARACFATALQLDPNLEAAKKSLAALDTEEK